MVMPNYVLIRIWYKLKYIVFRNNSDKISKIHACDILDEIVEFCKKESDCMYIVIDQMNVLDDHNNTEINKSTKQWTIEFLSQNIIILLAKQCIGTAS